MKRYDRWTEADRDQLRELAKVNTSDHAIADLMRRPRSSVSWQRRTLRIKLKPAPISRRKQAEKEIMLVPEQPSRRERIERMMVLSEMCL